MAFFGLISSVLGTVVTPVMLFLAAASVCTSVPFLKIISPRRFSRTLADLPESGKSSPASALSLALAGTLGVGNITGVASALIAGGPGAVFWMWVGSLVVLPVKYAEVSLAVSYRRREKGGFIGGAMYYIRDGLSRMLSPRVCKLFGGFFAVLCCLNSIVTGNIVQSNAAASILPENMRLGCGIALAALVAVTVAVGAERVNRVTSLVIPPLCAVYIVIAAWVIVSNITLVPTVLKDIVVSAFRARSFFGGAIGFSVRQAMRFGIMRGIFSNEAGCGTSPTAHASAETKSPHHQACYGVVEVVFDTLILCTLTALVLLIADRRFSCLPWGGSIDASPITLDAFTSLTSGWVYYILTASIFLFAYSTVIAQLYYGWVALGYFGRKKTPRVIYSVITPLACIVGSVMTSDAMWLTADLLIGTMTAVNCGVVILLRRRLSRPCDP